MVQWRDLLRLPMEIDISFRFLEIPQVDMIYEQAFPCLKKIFLRSMATELFPTSFVAHNPY